MRAQCPGGAGLRPNKGSPLVMTSTSRSSCRQGRAAEVGDVQIGEEDIGCTCVLRPVPKRNFARDGRASGSCGQAPQGERCCPAASLRRLLVATAAARRHPEPCWRRPEAASTTPRPLRGRCRTDGRWGTVRLARRRAWAVLPKIRSDQSPVLQHMGMNGHATQPFR